MNRNTIPRCTYRLQLHKDFDFVQAGKLAGYLADLGVSHCYTSPFFRARPGSDHGYDVTNPDDFNPEIGDEQAFSAFVSVLRTKGLFLLVDLVPNHMGIMGSENPWWLDVLENGPASPYASFFDIDWQPLKKSLRNRILVPVLGNHYGHELETGRLQLFFHGAEGSFAVRYHEHLFPIDPRTYPLLLRYKLKKFSEVIGREHPDLAALHDILGLCLMMPTRSIGSAKKKKQRHDAGRRIKEKLAALSSASQVFRTHITEIVEELNGTPGQRRSFVALDQLLERQAYRLSYWKVAAEEINYRRFFDINDLAGLRVERDEVFAETHRLLFRLVESGYIDGLRIDHIDGLYDPAAYLRRLRERLDFLQPGRQLFLVVEKILIQEEKLPADWRIHGTTGYDFGVQVNGIFIASRNREKMSRVYREMTGTTADFAEILRKSKKNILLESLAGELNTLANRLAGLAETDWQSRDFTFNSLRQALIEIMASFPVYRTYIAGRRISEADRQIIQNAVELAKSHNPGSGRKIFDFIGALLLQQSGWLFRRPDRKAVQDFTMRLQQLTAPVTAKGLEDTALYRFNRLVSENEVGSNPAVFGLDLEAFHRANRERLVNRPHGMLATSTHDSKRSEDVRARLNVLSEIPGEWLKTVERWYRINRRYGREIDGRRVPDSDEEYQLYQNLLGIWPLTEPDSDEYSILQGRFSSYALKAAREAKCNTSWRNPDERYEKMQQEFIEALFADRGSEFWRDFLRLHWKLAFFGLYNSLSQVLLKMTVPGVPDIYQGCELWDFSLVDPDNRRPVDFRLRKQMLQELQTSGIDGESVHKKLDNMTSDMEDGRIKMYVTWRSLRLRSLYPELFAEGDYIALSAAGNYRHHVCAFLRRRSDQTVVVTVPRLLWQLTGGDPGIRPLGEVWKDTKLELPAEYEASVFRCQFSGRSLKPVADSGRLFLPLSRILEHFPVGLLVES